MLVDAQRLRADFDALAAIGRTSTGGLSRTTFSDAHFEARAWFLERAREAGLATSVDSAGNHSARLPGLRSDTLLLGSHLDTVPDGGAYDGALGVLAALEVLRAVRDAGVALPVALEAIDFTDEEGTLLGLLGSRALAGTLTREMLATPRGGRAALVAGLERAGLTEDRLFDARRDPGTLAGYLELHIEQGPLLERDGLDIGVVSAIAGSRSFRLRYEGDARHAGTTPMGARRDALAGASRFVLAARDLAAAAGAGCVATVGRLEVAPGAFNVVPGSARLALEFRAPSREQLDALETELMSAAHGSAASEGLSVAVEPVGRWDPVALDASFQAAIADAAAGLGLRATPIVSGAGHDAESLAAVTRAGMVFVPSVAGVSHDSAEHTPWQACVNGANVLLGAALTIARG